MVSSAHKAVKKLVKGETFGTIEKVKDSTALAAAGMILDRDQPIVHKTENVNLNINASPVDLNKYRTGRVKVETDTPETEVNTVDNE